MTLLVEILERPLDPGYAATAARREAAGLPRSTGTRTWLLGVAALLIGFLLAVAGHALRPTGTSASREKAQLVEQVQTRRAHGDTQVGVIERLRSEIKTYQDQSLTGDRAGLATRLAALELTTGASAAMGPGLTITLNDASSSGVSGSDPRGGSGGSGGAAANGSVGGDSDPGRVTATDLQIITNGLWQSGADAVSINGQRLTAKSAIRFAGQAVLVDFRPLTPPYVISALGDQSTLPGTFAQTIAGSYLTALRANYGIASSIATSANLTLPAAAALDVASARGTSSGASGLPSTSSSAAASSPTTASTATGTKETP